jgi:aldehyde dehydrogenase (NAD+)
MGGKNAVIVADDADLATAVEATVSGAMRSAGQKCTATSRVILLPGVRDAFRDALKARLGTLAVGDPLDPATYVGPVVSQPQHAKVLSLIAQGRQEGARVTVGGEAPGGPLDHGWYVAPTLFEDVTPTMTIAQEEIFGPVLALLEARSLDEAVDIVNGVRYGLSASIFTRDIATALEAVERLDVGLVRVNEETAGVELQAPFGGMKASSSHSREQGTAAREFYTETKTVAIRPVPRT